MKATVGCDTAKTEETSNRSKGIMKRMTGSVSWCTAYCGIVGCMLFLVSSASSDLIGLTGTVTDPVLTTGSGLDEAELVSFKIGDTTYTNFEVLEATTISGTSSPFARAGNTVPTKTAALSGPYITQGVVNNPAIVMNIGTTVSAADNKIFFVYEMGGNDDFTVTPLDSDQNAIGAWSLTVGTSDYGTPTAAFNITFVSGNFTAAGVSFTLDDFTGDTGTLNDVSFLRFADAAYTWDPLMVGMIPEPTSLMLLGLGALALLRRRRR